MDSLNPGKMVSQGIHAGNQFTAYMDREFSEVNHPMNAMYHEWLAQAEDFGTTITLGVDVQMLYKVVEFASQAGFPAKVTHDPTYPIKDGSTVHQLPVDTCGFVFGDKQKLEALLGQFGLLP